MFPYEAIDTSEVANMSDKHLLGYIRANCNLVSVSGFGLIAELCKRFSIMIDDEDYKYIQATREQEIKYQEFLKELPPISEESVKELQAAIRGEPILKDTEKFYKRGKMSFWDAFWTRILHNRIK